MINRDERSSNIHHSIGNSDKNDTSIRLFVKCSIGDFICISNPRFAMNSPRNIREVLFKDIGINRCDIRFVKE